MKDNRENKESAGNKKKDESVEEKSDLSLGSISEPLTVEEPKSNKNKKATAVTLRSSSSSSSTSSTSTTIDNIAYQPLYTQSHHIPDSTFSTRPISGFAGEAFSDPYETYVSSYDIVTSTVASQTIDRQLGLQNEINELKAKYSQKLKELRSLKEDSEGKKEKIAELEKDRQELLKKENLRHLISRVNEEAREKLFQSEEFKNLFDMGNTCQVVVMSIDIRRSTEMMLKAKNPKLYAEFITSLCQALSEIILSNYGVFDKFTGDGILAFFPDFYSGTDAIYYALKAAEDCHEIFKIHYKKNRHCFITVLNEVGLGIGIDFGEAYLANVNKELTIVGPPVVYACRMSGAEYGETLLNQPAFELLKKKYPKFCEFTETELKLKHEGGALAYKVKFNHKPLDISPPNWNELIEEFKGKIDK